MATIVTNKNVPLINLKQPQFMAIAPSSTTTGCAVISDQAEEGNLALYVVSSTVHYMYQHDQDSWVQVPSGNFGGLFGAGTCGARARWSTTLTANAGTTTSLKTSANINGISGSDFSRKIKFLTGANAGLVSKVTSSEIIVNADNYVYFEALPNPVSNGDTFVIDTGRFYVWNAGTMSATSFRMYDPMLATWTSLSVTGAPASWGTDGRMVSTTSKNPIAIGTATSGTTNTLINTGKAWATNQWVNSQVRITAGTGKGQERTISSNTLTTLTVSANWTTIPNATSVYEITGNDDYLYLLGNNSVTMYRYSISTNTWTTLSPVVARSSAPGTGMGAEWAGLIDDPLWSDETDIQSGRYIYSLRGGGTTTIHRYDIALNSWTDIAYNNAAETFTTGTSTVLMGDYLYINKESTGRMFRFDIPGNYLQGFTTALYPQSTALIGNKIWGKKYRDDNGSVELSWIYWLGNNQNILQRMLII